LERLFPNAIRFSNYSNQKTNVLLVGSIGILAQLYGHADAAYVGGGFGSGLHNILEAAAYGIPVIFFFFFGRFADAEIMVYERMAISISNTYDLHSAVLDVLRSDLPDQDILAFMTKRTGAKKSILAYLETTLSK
jgi:3-deoxy-D-manno-octulosonic-acid transferase